MKRILLVVGSLALFMTSCGIQKLAEDTRDGVQDSNKKQEELLEQIRKTNAETARLKELTQELVRGMAKTNEGVHLQILTQALQGLMSKESTDLLMPPLRMMPFAQVFTQEATAHEILEVVHTLTQEVLLGYEKDEKGDKRVRSRTIALTAASALAAFTPRAKLEEIFRTQIETKGNLEDTAYLFGLCRYNFTRDYFFKSILGYTNLNVDSLRKIVSYFNEMKYIATRPYADKFKIKAEQFVTVPVAGKDTYEDLVDELKASEVPGLGRSAVRRFENAETGLKPEVLKSSEARDLLTKLK